MISSMSAARPVLLTTFGYQRKVWIEPIEKLRDVFDVRYIHFTRAEEETVRNTSAPVYYWNEFTDAWMLLKTIKPDLILFFGLDSGMAIALNFAAKKMNIPTIYLQHGLYSSFKDYRNIEKLTRIARRGQAAGLSPKRASSPRFIIDTFKKGNGYFSLLLTFIYIKLGGILKSSYLAARLCPFRVRMPDHYICFTHRNSLIHRQIDLIDEKQISYIGFPEMDVYFNTSANESQQTPYLLLIDQPLSENTFGNIFTTIDNHVRFYEKVARFAHRQGCSLKIKLHPETYKATWLPDIEGVEYVRDVQQVEQLILQASACVGFYSTLIIPAIYFKPSLLFEHMPHSFYDFIKEHHVCPVVDYYNFNENDLVMSNEKGNRNNAFVHSFVPFSDGRSLQRLRDSVMNQLS